MFRKYTLLTHRNCGFNAERLAFQRAFVLLGLKRMFQHLKVGEKYRPFVVMCKIIMIDSLCQYVYENVSNYSAAKKCNSWLMR